MQFLCFLSCGCVGFLTDCISVKHISCLQQPNAYYCMLLCLMCCMAAKWDYGEEVQRKCLSQDAREEERPSTTQSTECMAAP